MKEDQAEGLISVSEWGRGGAGLGLSVLSVIPL